MLVCAAACYNGILGYPGEGPIVGVGALSGPAGASCSNTGTHYGSEEEVDFLCDTCAGFLQMLFAHSVGSRVDEDETSPGHDVCVVFEIVRLGQIFGVIVNFFVLMSFQHHLETFNDV